MTLTVRMLARFSKVSRTAVETRALVAALPGSPVPMPVSRQIVHQECPRARRVAILDASTAIRGRPSLRPFALAFRKPALTRSWISDRSNSAIAPIIRNISRSEGVLRSWLSLRLAKIMPSASNSAKVFTRCFNDRPKRSSFQTKPTSGRNVI